MEWITLQGKRLLVSITRRNGHQKLVNESLQITHQIMCHSEIIFESRRDPDDFLQGEL